MPVSPLPFFRSPRDNDALDGRGGPAGRSRAPAARPGFTDLPAQDDFGASSRAGTPMLLVDDGRSALTALHEAREHAERLGQGLEQLDAAAESAASVERLLGRLRDAAVRGASRDLEPARRAILQRGVDQTLAEIDAIAEGTVFDQGLLRAGAGAVQRRGAASGPTPFKQIGTASLALNDLAVRSPDQALAAAGSLDVASSRIERVTGSIRRAIARFEAGLAGLTSSPVTATGELALGNTTAAFGSTISLRSDLLADPGNAVRAQADLDVTRVFRLLDSGGR